MSKKQKLLATGVALFLILTYPAIMFHWGKTGVLLTCLAAAGFAGAYLGGEELVRQGLRSSEVKSGTELDGMEHEKWLLAGLEEPWAEDPEAYPEGLYVERGRDEVAQEEEELEVLREAEEVEPEEAEAVGFYGAGSEVEGAGEEEALPASPEEESWEEKETKEISYGEEREARFETEGEEERSCEQEVVDECFDETEDEIERGQGVPSGEAVDSPEQQIEKEESCEFPMAIDVSDDKLSLEEVRDDELNTLIEEGFEAKNEGKWAEARELFAQALSLSPSEELSYLLNLEISHLSGNLGDYEEAIAALARAEVCGPETERWNVVRQARYLKAVAELLDVMALPRVPLYEVPRMVRIKAEQMAEEKTGGWRE